LGFSLIWCTNQWTNWFQRR